MRIILADHDPQACPALKASLSAQPGFVLVGEALDAQELLTLAQNKGVDLVLFNSELPGCPFEELITRLHSLPSRPKVIAMSTRLECGSAMLKAGADAFVSKGDQPDWLLEKLQQYM